MRLVSGDDYRSLRRSYLRTYGRSQFNSSRRERSFIKRIIVDRISSVVICALCLVAWLLYLVFASPQPAAADPITVKVSQLVTNPHSKGGTGHFIRVEGPTSSVAYCAQGWLITPPEGQSLECYGSLEIPELDYVMYHGYDGTMITSVYGLDEQRSEMATMAAVWLAIGDKRGDILNFIPNVDEPFHGNKMYLERWQSIEDESIKQAAYDLYQEALDYAEDGGGGIEEGCATFWSNRNAYEADGTFSYQGVITADKELLVTFCKVSDDEAVTDNNEAYSLADAEYSIYLAESDDLVTSFTTDDEGRATCRLKPDTSYYAVETKAPAGYELNEERIEFVTEQDAIEIVLTDSPQRLQLTVKKVDAATGNDAQPTLSLEGAEFSVTDAQGNTRTSTIDGTGTATIENLPLGPVYVQEMKAPTGYVLDETVHEVILGDAEGDDELAPTQELIVENTPVAFDIAIEKTLNGEAAEESAKGIAFDIISNTTDEVIGTIVTDEEGHADTADTWFGAGTRPDNASGAIPYDAAGYTVREDPDTTPDGFEAAEPWSITADQIVDGVSLSFDVDNAVVASQLTIVKVDKATGQPIPLAGFTFSILDAQGNQLSADSWFPTAPEQNTFTTDETGTVAIPQKLRRGTYCVKETQAPEPYLLADELIPFEVEASSDEPAVVVEIADAAATGQGKIVKTGSQNESPLAGAAFDVVAQLDVVAPDGTVQVRTGEIVDQVITDEDGIATTKELPLGSGEATYAFIETAAPDGYVVNPDPVPFTLSYQDPETEVVTTEVTYTNDPTTVTITKVSAGDQEPVAGAAFALTRIDEQAESPSAGEAEETPDIGAEEPEGDTGVNDDDGTDSGSDAEGDTGIVEDRSSDEATADDAENTQDAAEDMEPGNPDPDEPADDSIVEEPDSTYTTDADGTVIITCLAPGIYRLQELEAPAGYLVDDAPREFTVDQDGLIDGSSMLSLTFENDYTKVDISKRSSVDESCLAGAHLTLIDAEGKEVDSWETSDTPHRIEKIAPGTYQLAETEAPDGYDTAGAMEIVIEKTAEVQAFTLYNDPVEIAALVDKRRVNSEGSSGDRETFSYVIDAKNDSSSWVDECTVTDTLDSALQGLVELTSVTTPIAQGDHDGLLNVWYYLADSDAQPETSDANATTADDEGNPRLEEEQQELITGDDQRVLDYNGWHLWAEGVSTSEATTLDVADLNLATGSLITAVRFEFGRVEEDFTTRANLDASSLLKDEQDTVEPEEIGSENLSPMRIEMRASATYVSGDAVVNSVQIDEYRNGGGDGLEAHDTDLVRYEGEPEFRPLDQTGFHIIGGTLLGTGAICAFGAWAGLGKRTRAIR